MENDLQKYGWPGWNTVGILGKGGFGTVYEIQRQIFDKTERAALKVISIPQSESELKELYSEGYGKESIATVYQSQLKRLVDEYSLMRLLSDCPQVVSCDDIRYEPHDDGIGWDIYIKMELLTPLLDALPLQIPEATVVKIAIDMCKALEACQQQNLIHRDIKPQNIFLSDSGIYKLGDFGIAKAAESTMGGTKIGTYKYMAPEVYNNQPYGIAADICSLGLVMYWLLNNRRMPFLPMPPAVPSYAQEEEAKMRRFSGQLLPAPAHGSPALQQIVLKACAFHPAQRYHTAAQLRAALETLTTANTVPVVPSVVPPIADPDKTVRVRQSAGSMEQAVRTAPPPVMRQPVPPQAPVPPTVPSPKKKSPALPILLACLALVAAIILIFVLNPKDNNDGDTVLGTTQKEEKETKSKKPAPETTLPGRETTPSATTGIPTPPAPSTPGITSYEEFLAANLNETVCIESNVQAYQEWWNDTVTIYLQDQEGAYFAYEVACTEEEAARLTPGTRVRIIGEKAEWAGELEIMYGTLEFLDGPTYIAQPEDVTHLLGTDALEYKMNRLVTFKGMTVESVAFKNGESGDDIYITVSKNDAFYEFTVEKYLTGPETALYKQVSALQRGDMIDATGFLYWYEGPCPHITEIAVQ